MERRITEFPRPRGRGTIEADMPRSGKIVQLWGFHVREDVAPLKPVRCRTAGSISDRFHVREDVAPLKRGDGAEDRRVGRRFHVREDVAPLKPGRPYCKSGG